MSIAAYLESVKELLLLSEIVVSFRIVRERATLTDGYLRIRSNLSDGSMLEFSEYVQRNAQANIQVITYSYHWADEQDQLNRRWDNTPHFPDLPDFPHHIHEGKSGKILPGSPTNIFQVLNFIARLMK